MSVVQPTMERKARRLPQVQLAARAVRQHIDLKTFFTWLIQKKVCLRRVEAISKSLKIRLQNVQDNEVVMPETARAPENEAPKENPHAGWNC
jgi:hypothetical protein